MRFFAFKQYLDEIFGLNNT